VKKTNLFGWITTLERETRRRPMTSDEARDFKRAYHRNVNIVRVHPDFHRLLKRVSGFMLMPDELCDLMGREGLLDRMIRIEKIWSLLQDELRGHARDEFKRRLDLEDGRTK
jgi:hypothetical protein